MIRASSPQKVKTGEDLDVAAAVQRLRVTFNVSVGGTAGKHLASGARSEGDCRDQLGVGVAVGIAGKGESKCRGTAEDAMGGFGAPRAARKMSKLAAPEASSSSKQGNNSGLPSDGAASTRRVDVGVS